MLVMGPGNHHLLVARGMQQQVVKAVLLTGKYIKNKHNQLIMIGRSEAPLELQHVPQ